MRVAAHFAGWLIGAAQAETQTTPAERALLAHYARGARRVVEVGVWHGVTTSLLRGAMSPDGAIWAVDPFPAGRLGLNLQRIVARHTVERVPGAPVVWQRTTGVEAAARYARSEPPACLVFIDGDHSFAATAAEWRAWSPLVRAGGVVCLHDSRPTPDRPIDDAGSVRATREVVLQDPAYVEADAVDSLTVVRRRP